MELRIKDSVDLKELEKFNFGLCKTKKWNEPDECYKPEYYERVKCKFRDYGKTTYQRIVIYVSDRRIRFYNLAGRTWGKNWANDLIEAGLVEKCEE